MTLGKLLKQRRELLMLTLRQVEEAAGVSNAYLSQLENEKIKKPSVSVMDKLARLYGMPLDDLLIASGMLHSVGTGFVKTVSSPFNGVVLTADEEKQLIQYLGFLRYQKQKEG
jgi:transcriptional regulator with XRE-family HTH domain